MGLAYGRWKEGPCSKVITKRYGLRPMPVFKQALSEYEKTPGNRGAQMWTADLGDGPYTGGRVPSARGVVLRDLWLPRAGKGTEP